MAVETYGCGVHALISIDCLRAVLFVFPYIRAFRNFTAAEMSASGFVPTSRSIVR